jgi:hypothetical protein
MSKESIMESIQSKYNDIDTSLIKDIFMLRREGYFLLLFDEKALIFNSGCEYIANIQIPQNINKAICFHDVYYDANILKLIVATRDSYDVALTVNEEQWDISNINITK